MTTKQKFEAAVNVIRNLPKNGSYQPSNALMLDFYAYYKQATEGWERGRRPGFWDVVARAKFDAWNKLGTMPKEEAMQRYIDELNKIIETMSLTDNVAEFLQSMESYPGNPEDIELSIGPLLERVRSQPGSPFASQNTTPSRRADSPSSTPSHISDVDEEDEDEFVDSLPVSPGKDESLPHAKRKDTPIVMPMTNPNLLVYPNHGENKLLNGYANHHKVPSKDPVYDALQKAVESLRRDLTLANEKVKALEERQLMVRTRNTFLGMGMAPGTMAFVVLWPIVVHYFITWLSKRKHR